MNCLHKYNYSIKLQSCNYLFTMWMKNWRMIHKNSEKLTYDTQKFRKIGVWYTNILGLLNEELAYDIKTLRNYWMKDWRMTHKQPGLLCSLLAQVSSLGSVPSAWQRSQAYQLVPKSVLRDAWAGTFCIGCRRGLA